MAHVEWDVDRIVREVLRRLTSASAGAHDPSASTPPPSISSSQSRSQSLRTPNVDELAYVIPERVVTLASLERIADGVREIVVSTRAVITPAATDEIRARGMSLRRDDVSTKSAGGGASVALWIDASCQQAAKVGAQLAAELQGAATLRSELASVGKSIAGHIRGRRLVVILTPQPKAAVCLTNRLRSVRAAEAMCLRSLAAAQKQAAINVLVIDPVEVSAAMAGELTNAFISAGWASESAAVRRSFGQGGGDAYC